MHLSLVVKPRELPGPVFVRPNYPAAFLYKSVSLRTRDRVTVLGVEGTAAISRPFRAASGTARQSSAVPPHSQPLARLAVLISGGGRSLLNLLDACQRGDVPATIPLVIASRECLGAERARLRGLRVHVMPGPPDAARLGVLFREFDIGFIILAGYLSLLPIPPGFESRVVNIHPALLPKFGGKGMYGKHVHQAVLAAGERVSGCTVHLCDNEYDRGEIILRATCPVLAGDTTDTLAARVFDRECVALPEAVRRLATGDWKPGDPAGELADAARR
jgi:phosphoribosylglycinamide formyltransferase 1